MLFQKYPPKFDPTIFDLYVRPKYFRPSHPARFPLGGPSPFKSAEQISACRLTWKKKA